MTGGLPLVIVSAGYLGSILIGSALIMAAFDTSASKVASLIVFPLFIICFWFGRTWARIRILGCIGLSIGFWFSELDEQRQDAEWPVPLTFLLAITVKEAHYLRFYVLFIGVVS